MDNESDLTANAETNLPRAKGVMLPQRTRLLEALRDLDQRLGNMYLAAIRMMDDKDLEDAICLAGHAMREMMERLPEALDLPLDQKSRLFNHVNQLEQAVEEAQSRSACATDDGWAGTIDPPLASLIASAEGLIADRKEFFLSRRESATQLMRRLEPGFIQRTEPMAKSETTAWMENRRYFEQVSHHHYVYGDLETNSAEFESRVREVERTLLTKLRPPTAADFAEIDSLMRRFEAP